MTKELKRPESNPLKWFGAVIISSSSFPLWCGGNFEQLAKTERDNLIRAELRCRKLGCWEENEALALHAPSPYPLVSCLSGSLPCRLPRCAIERQIIETSPFVDTVHFSVGQNDFVETDLINSTYWLLWRQLKWHSEVLIACQDTILNPNW